MSFPSSLRRHGSTLFALASIVFAASCGGDSGTNPNAPFGGDYLLKTINGKPLPATIGISGGTVQLNSMRLTILQDGSYTQHGDYTPLTYSGTVQNDAVGTWSRDSTNGAIALMDPAGFPWAAGTASGNMLTLTQTFVVGTGTTWVYQR